MQEYLRLLKKSNRNLPATQEELLYRFRTERPYKKVY